MLKQIHIQNYAIIDELRIDFSDRLNIITGETGAGKSILTGALALVLGERADTSVLLNREKKCFVEGVFQIPGKNKAALFLKENDLDSEEELVIRREISPNGKSRAFVNDTPVNLDQLNLLGHLLVDLHQQFDSLELAEAEFQLAVLDVLADNADLLSGYKAVYQQWATVQKEWKQLAEQQSRLEKDQDYNRFLKAELDEAGFRDHELEDLDNELRLMSHAEGIKSLLSRMYFSLEEGDDAVVHLIRSLSHQLKAFESCHPAFPQILQRLESAQVELKDIAEELDSINGKVQYDAGRMEDINERLALGQRLLKKHGLRGTNELMDLGTELEKKLQTGIDLAASLEAREKESGVLSAKAHELANALSDRRRNQIPFFEKKVKGLLEKVGMPNARLQVSMRTVPLYIEGTDQAEFLFDANRSDRFETLRKVASGGELSRLMLSIKSLVAQYMDLPTLIFDEIDTGISGEAAKQVGLILKELSGRRQVICITHQPQIAGKADAHFFVYKKVSGGMIRTQVKQLSLEERITAIAQMLSGEKPTNAALQNAREMVHG
jgi:DNA repair protein RecN (Recombination protein N)